MVMRAEDFHEFTRRRPFKPFRLHASNGRIYDIRHPDQIMPLYSKVIVGVGGEGNVPDHAEHLSMNHVVRLVRLEESQDAATRKAS